MVSFQGPKLTVKPPGIEICSGLPEDPMQYEGLGRITSRTFRNLENSGPPQRPLEYPRGWQW